MECSTCKTELPDEARFCWQCGQRQGRGHDQQDERYDAAEEDEEEDVELVSPRYGALATIADIYRVFGWVVILGGSIGSIISGVGVAGLIEGDGGMGAGVAIAIIVGGILVSILYGIFMLALADVMQLLIDVERNTRASALNLAEAE